MANAHSYGGNLYSGNLPSISLGQNNWNNLPQSSVDFFVKSGLLKQLGMPPTSQQTPQGPAFGGDPFSSAMSGNQKGTLQPYINRMTGNANSALYGGLLGYQPQQLIAGNAGGTPVNPQAPQNFSLPPGLLNANMGNRHWMK